MGNIKIKYRKGIHETNSSSSHSFSMGPGGRYTGKLKISQDDFIYIHGGELWDLDKTNDSMAKLSYLLCTIWTWALEDDQDSESGYNINLQVYHEYFDVLEGVVTNFTGAKGIVFDNPEGDTIDHQSQYLIDPRDMRDPEFLKEFIFNPETYLYPIWDSYSPSRGFFKVQGDSGLYKFSFNLPGVDKREIEIKASEAKQLDYLIVDLLDNIYYDTSTKDFKEYKREHFWTNIPDGYIGYTGGFKFGEDIEVLPEIEIL